MEGHRPPFTLIADKSNKERVYPWGTCELDNRKHSDFPLFRELVLLEHLESMHSQAVDTYDRVYYQPLQEQKQGFLNAEYNQYFKDKWNKLKTEFKAVKLALTCWQALRIIFVFLLGFQCAIELWLPQVCNLPSPMVSIVPVSFDYAALDCPPPMRVHPSRAPSMHTRLRSHTQSQMLDRHNHTHQTRHPGSRSHRSQTF